MLMREVMRTELVRVRALIIVALVDHAHRFAASTSVVPDVVQRIWRGGVNPNAIYPILTGFILFELVVYRTISHHLEARSGPAGVPALYRRADRNQRCRRFILSLQIESMGPVRALGFVDAAGLFHLHHSFDAAARFLAVGLHRLRGGSRAVRDGDALQAAGQSRSASRRSTIICRAACDPVRLRPARGRGRRSSCAAALPRASAPRPRATASPTCSASTSRRRWWSGCCSKAPAPRATSGRSR